MTTFVQNRRLHFNFEIIEKIEAGIELLGLEVKSIKKSQGSLDGAYVLIRGGEAYAINLFIPPYQEKNTPPNYEPYRNRRLIMTKKEIKKLADVESKGSLTIIPISLYNKGNLIKVSIAIVRGKKKFDKRETIKKRETDREIRREMKGR